MTCHQQQSKRNHPKKKKVDVYITSCFVEICELRSYYLLNIPAAQKLQRVGSLKGGKTSVLYVVLSFIMSKEIYNLLTDIAARCNVKNDKALRKTKELITLLNSKQQLNCSDTCKVVVCLELASSLSSSPLIREEAIKYSGYKKKNYNNIFNNISKLLNLDKIYSVGEICLLVGAADVKEQAGRLLQKYKSSTQETDFEHPMYACAAILTYCRSNKIKINLAKLVEISRLKKTELEELSKKLQAFLDIKKKNDATVKKKLKSADKNEVEKAEGHSPPKKMKNTTGVMSDKEYEEWKRRMLED